jgi:hypothetical protein
VLEGGHLPSKHHKTFICSNKQPTKQPKPQTTKNLIDTTFISIINTKNNMSAITTQPLWIADILTTLQEAGTDEASFEMVERLTEELIAKEEKMMAMEKTIEDLVKEKAKLTCRSILYGERVESYIGMVYEPETDNQDTIGNSEEWGDNVYDGGHYEKLIKEHLDSFDTHKELLSKMPCDLPWEQELLSGLCDSMWETFHLEVEQMDTDVVIEQFDIDVESNLYQEAYQVSKGFGRSDRYAKNYAIREYLTEIGAGTSLYIIAEDEGVLDKYINLYGEKDYFLICA